MKTRREELTEEIQSLDRKIYALQHDREELQRKFDETPETQAGEHDVEDSMREAFKAYGEDLIRSGRVIPLSETPGGISRGGFDR